MHCGLCTNGCISLTLEDRFTHPEQIFETCTTLMRKGNAGSLDIRNLPSTVLFVVLCATFCYLKSALCMKNIYMCVYCL